MGRAGGGGGGGRAGGGSRPGGGGSRAGGGFRPGSTGSSRPGSGGSRAGGGFRPGSTGGGTRPGAGGRPGGGPGAGGPAGPGGMRGPGRRMTPPPPRRPPRHGFIYRHFGGFWPFRRYYAGGGFGCSGCLTPVVLFILIIAIIIAAFSGSFSRRSASRNNEPVYIESASDYSGSGSGTDLNSANNVSSGSRTKVNTGVSFTSDCVIDELGWVDDTASTGKALKDFYDATGVQPFAYFKAYDSSLTSDSDKAKYAQDWYEDNIDNEGTFLFIYFAEEDSENDVGYMYYVAGDDITSVMDDDAAQVFWNYVNEYWYSDLSTDDMIIEMFNSTAEAIM